MKSEGGTVLRPQCGSCVDLVARKAIVVSIKEDSESVGRSRPIEVRAVNIDPPHHPAVILHNKIVR